MRVNQIINIKFKDRFFGHMVAADINCKHKHTSSGHKAT